MRTPPLAAAAAAAAVLLLEGEGRQDLRSQASLISRHEPGHAGEPAADGPAAATRRGRAGEGESSAAAAAAAAGGGGGGAKRGSPSWEEAAPGLLLALFAGVATSFGAVALPFLPPGGPPPCAMAFAMCLAAGVMIMVAAEMLWPALEAGGWWPVLLFSASALVCFVCCRLGDLIDGHHHHHHGSSGVGADGSEGTTKAKTSEARSRRLALLLLFSLTAHNLPEGFAVAVSTISGRWFGVTVCIAVALHNVPEGLTLAVATYDWTKSRWKAVLVPTLAGLAEPLGAVLAMSLFRDRITAQLIDDLLVSVAGVMFCIALAELLPEAASTRCWRCGLCGLLCGAAVLYFTHQVIDHAAGGHGHSHSHGHELGLFF